MTVDNDTLCIWSWLSFKRYANRFNKQSIRLKNRLIPFRAVWINWSDSSSLYGCAKNFKK